MVSVEPLSSKRRGIRGAYRRKPHEVSRSLPCSSPSLPAWAADYSIMAPAAPGGGWDQTARTMQTADAEGEASPATCR